MNRIARKHVPGPIIIVLIYFLVGCAPQSAVSPTAVPTLQAAVSATETPIPTQTAVPSATSQPPTATPPPTATASPAPSFTPTANATAATTTIPLPTITETGVPTAVAPTGTAFAATNETPNETAPAAITLADLPNHLGEEVTVSGQVVSAESFSKGFKFTLDDGTARTVLLMWHDVYDESWAAPKLNVGATVQATGKVGQFEGEWQIEPDFGGDVKVTINGSTAPPRTVGELASHVDEMAQISGTILRLESTNSAVKIFVGDETGEIVVFVWRTILDRIPNNVALGEPGTRVRVNGRVENFRSNLELVPALPYDVEVLP